MIRIQKSCEVEDSFFNGRDFGESIETVKTVLAEVRDKKDAALHDYTSRYDVADPSVFEIPMETLKAAAEKMERENPNLYKSLCYSRDLALRFAKKQRESFDDFEVELRAVCLQGRKTLRLREPVCMFPQDVSPW